MHGGALVWSRLVRAGHETKAIWDFCLPSGAGVIRLAQWVSSIVVVVVMLLAAATANLKGKLSEKMRWRPTQMVMKKMPDGTAELSELPRRKADAVEGEFLRHPQLELHAQYARLSQCAMV